MWDLRSKRADFRIYYDEVRVSLPACCLKTCLKTSPHNWLRSSSETNMSMKGKKWSRYYCFFFCFLMKSSLALSYADLAAAIGMDSKALLNGSQILRIVPCTRVFVCITATWHVSAALLYFISERGLPRTTTSCCHSVSIEPSELSSTSQAFTRTMSFPNLPSLSDPVMCVPESSMWWQRPVVVCQSLQRKRVCFFSGRIGAPRAIVDVSKWKCLGVW